MNPINARLDAARHELLDLGLRNPLLNYRPLLARGVEVVDERPFSLYQHLVSKGEAFSFLAAETDSDTENDTEWGQPLEPHDRYTDDFLQTPYHDTELQKRLLTTYYTAREYIEEQGVNVLYLALGMLHWRESENSDTVRRAPLLLLPVTLQRESAASRFRLSYTGADISENLPLYTKLTLDFGLTLPPLLLAAGEVDLLAYFAAVAQAIYKMPGWEVNDTAVALGFFSFSKFLMVNDLDIANWPEARSPASHPVLQALLTPQGFPQPGPQLSDEAPLDAHIQLGKSHQVVDADSSQTVAILDVNAGHHLVIQGPPGTGKSQTITNLIAEALGNDKTVLFVAEKMAALDVVKRRLDEVGLGDACLELHSHKSTKSTFVAELARTLQLGQPKQDGRFPQLDMLQTIRDDLNAYSSAMNTPIGTSDTSLYDAYGYHLQLQAQMAHLNLPDLVIPQLSEWSDGEFTERLALVQTLQQHLTHTGVPAQHVFGDSQCADAPDALPNQIRQLAHMALTALQEMQTGAALLAAALDTAVPTHIAALAHLNFAAQRLQSAPKMTGINTTHTAWTTLPESVLAALEAGEHIHHAHDAYNQWLIPEAWQQPVLPIRQGLMAGRSSWRRLFSQAYRQAQQQLAGLCHTAPPPDWETQIGAVNAVLDVQRLYPVLQEMEPHLKEIFGLRWRGLDSNWADLINTAGWLVSIHESVKQGLYPASILHIATKNVDKSGLQTAVTLIETAQTAYETAVTALYEQLQVNSPPHDSSRPFTEQLDWLQRCYTAADTIKEIAAYNQQAQQLSQNGLAPLVPIANTWPDAAIHLTHLLLLTRCAALIHKAQTERTTLHSHYRQDPDHTIAQFRELDMEFLAHNRARLAHAHWQRLPRYAAGGQMGLLQAEMAKKRNHLPIRQLMAQAGYAIQYIKPIFMMSPLSIAAYLPPDKVQFDLVIFDEASQVQPVDAFGAIVRGKQIVVVGDSRQLPPTNFFERLLGHDRGEDHQASPESILDLFCAQNAPQRILRWHYRSRHESLIAVSNQEFYNQRLVVFPSPDAAKEEVGLRYHHLSHTAYQRGKSRTNPQEAAAVAAAVMQHTHMYPQLTLGVVAFSRGQRQAIRQQLERLRRQDTAAEAFFQAHPTEPFFVKNLENVQGDERDVILISVGYGRAADGSLTMNFGPLNQDGGERRLNVLITRARCRCEIFTNLTADNIDLRRTDAPGVVALKRYLHYASSGKMADLPPEPAAAAAPFEDAVAADLRQAGYTVAQRVGTGPVRVDLAVVDTKNGRYTLGIECDGDNYHLARTARDRDRIQAEALTRLGWRIQRLWSQQWWQNPESERERLLAAITTQPAPTTNLLATPPRPGYPLFTRYDPQETAVTPRPISLYQPATPTIDLEGHNFSHYYAANKPSYRQNLRNLLIEIVQQEGPIHRTEAMRRMSYAAGYQMLAIPDYMEEGLLQQGQESGQIMCLDDFLWPVEMQHPTVRDRSQLPQVSRKFEYICPEEIAAAVLFVVKDALGILHDDVPHRVGQLFGFRQIGGSSKTAVFHAINALLEQGALQQQESELFFIQNPPGPSPHTQQVQSKKFLSSVTVTLMDALTRSKKTP